MKLPVFTRRKHLALYRLITWLQSEKNGRCVLKGEARWTKINGVLINTKRWGSLQILFRRRGLK